MRKLLIVGLMALSACGPKNGVTSKEGEPAFEDRNVSGFSSVEVKGKGTLYLTQSDKETLEIEASDNIIGFVSSVVSGDTLHLEVHPKAGQKIGEVKYHLTVTELENLKLSGAANAVSKNQLKVDNLQVIIAGSSDASLNVKGEGIEVEVQGAGKITVEGEVEDEKIEINGVGHYNGANLVAKEVDIEINGTGVVSVNAQKELDVKITGGGVVSYLGNPKVSQRVSGSGRVERLKKDGGQAPRRTSPSQPKDNKKNI